MQSTKSAQGVRSLAARVRLQFATATLAAASGAGLGFLYARYALENASRGLTGMYASLGAVAALMVLRTCALAYQVFRNR